MDRIFTCEYCKLTTRYDTLEYKHVCPVVNDFTPKLGKLDKNGMPIIEEFNILRLDPNPIYPIPTES